MVIHCENISFNYGVKQVLDDISLQFGKGQLYGILGPNGSGKTTFLKILSGLLKLNYGKVIVDELDIKKLSSREIAKKIALVPQTSHIDFDFSVKEIVMMGRYAHVGRFSQESLKDKKIVDDILNQFDLIELKDRYFNELSGGEQQKVIIARAIAQQSKIILLDEPTTHLDINYQIEFMEMIKQYIKEGMIVVVVLHNLNLATQFCDKVVLLDEGRIKAFGSIEEIITRDNIKSVYKIDVIVRKNVFTNSIYITPLRYEVPSSLQYKNGDKIKKIHVVAGGGSALEILPKLKMYDVSVGIINILDDDHTLASELDFKIISEAPFSPISRESSQKLKNLLKEIDIIVLTNLPFGKNNLENLKIINESNKPIIIFEKDQIEVRDFTDGIATKIYKEIKKKKNVKTVHNIEELFNFN
ncbi:MAG: ABC transporter ATP-binding protein [Promethearchaeota archaeon]